MTGERGWQSEAAEAYCIRARVVIATNVCIPHSNDMAFTLHHHLPELIDGWMGCMHACTA